MSLSSPTDRFRAAAEAMTPARIVVLLYERLQRDLGDAEAAFAAGDRYGAHRALVHAQEIVSELDGALDPTVWSEAPRMSQLYGFVASHLVEANVRQDIGALRACRAVIDPLVETWRDAWKQNAAGAPERATAPTGAAAVRVPLDVAG